MGTSDVRPMLAARAFGAELEAIQFRLLDEAVDIFDSKLRRDFEMVILNGRAGDIAPSLLVLV
jgi:hypothetical protein